jgi:DNA polymerase-3 subunit delta
LFRGTKVVLVQPAEFLASRRPVGGGDSWSKARDLWQAGKQREAAKRVLALAGRAGFQLEVLAARTEADWQAAGLRIEARDRGWIAAAVEVAIAAEMQIPEADTRALEDLLEKGLPEHHHLIAVAEDLDRSAAVTRACLAAGQELVREFASSSGPPGKRAPADIGRLSEEVLRPLGKRMSPEAGRVLVGRAGEDARLLTQELEKLAAYVGERDEITPHDVRELVAQVAGDDFFAVSNALEARDPRALIEAIGNEIDAGGAPLRVLGGLASSIRGMLATRAQLALLGAERPMSFQEFERRVLPTLAEADRAAGRKAGHPFRAYKRAEASLRYGLGELAQALGWLAEADLGIKTGTDARIWLERIALRLGSKAG